MFSLFKKRPTEPVHADINGIRVEVLPRETLLQAALRHNIAFPHSCRVGGCATCKCRLVDGTVRELTDNSYLLSAEEIAQGVILGCQSIPTSDISIDVDLESPTHCRRVTGRVVRQTRLTHDITSLTLQLQDTLDYRPGQFANLSLEALPGVERSYSFATPPSPDGCVSFFVRRVDNGQFSSLVDEQDLLGEAVNVDGPHGDFWLRPSDDDVLMIAGGSGLAPILAMLRDMQDKGGFKPVTLIFAARSQRDLYMQEEMQQLIERWPARFDYIPVLSREPADSSWQGARGRVNDVIPADALSSLSAYLCGPPGMVDSAEKKLIGDGVSAQNIYTDRFTTQADLAAPRHLHSA